MERIGFSTGSLARGDFHGALAMLRGRTGSAVELSALRVHELEPLMRAAPGLDLRRFRHVSIHAPGRFDAAEERDVVRLLRPAVARRWLVVLHPDTIHDPALWREFGGFLAIENMDARKPGRTAEELDPVFAALPQASFCFDVAHAHQCDPSMATARRLLVAHGNRLREVHVSELDAAGQHVAITPTAVAAFRRIARLIPATVPAIIEAPVAPSEIEAEIAASLEALGRTVPLLSAA